MNESLQEIKNEFLEAHFLNKIVLLCIYAGGIIQCLILLPLAPFFLWNIKDKQKCISGAINSANLKIDSFVFVVGDSGASLMSVNKVEHLVKVIPGGERQLAQERTLPSNPGERNAFIVEADIKEQDYYELRLFLLKLAETPTFMSGNFFVYFKNQEVEFKFDPINYWLTAPYKLKFR